MNSCEKLWSYRTVCLCGSIGQFPYRYHNKGQFSCIYFTSRKACCERGRARFSLVFESCRGGDPAPNLEKMRIMKVCDCKFSTAWGAAFSHRCASGSFLYRDGAASQRRLALVRDLRERESKMSVQRRSFVSTGPTRDDPAVNQIWAEWRRDGSGLRQGSLGVLVSVTVLSTWFIVLIYGRLT